MLLTHFRNWILKWLILSNVISSNAQARKRVEAVVILNNSLAVKETHNQKIDPNVKLFSYECCVACQITGCLVISLCLDGYSSNWVGVAFLKAVYSSTLAFLYD